jgi:hypothetical protein
VKRAVAGRPALREVLSILRRSAIIGGLGGPCGMIHARGSSCQADGGSRKSKQEVLAMTKEDYLRYIDHFNNKRYEKFAAYYAEDVEVNLSSITLKGPQGIISFYTDFHTYVREFVDVKFLVADDAGVAAEMYTEFDCFRDYPNTALPFKKGEVRRMLNFVHYDLADGKFKHIRVARYQQYV